MFTKYLLTIDNPDSHYLQVRLNLKDFLEVKNNIISLFIPSWSPGSYLMREYSRHLRRLEITDEKGCHINWIQTEKGTWQIEFNDEKEIIVSYEIYCHELTVRTSHITSEHAYLHGPTFYMGIKDVKQENIEIELKFPNLWSKISTGLESISKDRNIFRYKAKSYDELVDCPIEIGCHHTDGFNISGIPHEIAIWGKSDLNLKKVKEDIKTILEAVLVTTKEMPYKRYVIIAHLKPNIYGGLEHSNSTVLQFCSLKISNRDSYQDWLTLVAHEYFHTWNVKRIRPIELGPFNYTQENYTRMHWLTEGLTSFMDELLTLRSKLITLDDYLRMQKKNLDRYFKNRGKYFDSLEDSSFNAWIKLYRPDENSINSSVSYYLKGGISFWILNTYFVLQGKDINDLISLLWKRYKDNPEVGLIKDEIYQMIEKVGGVKVKNKFEIMIETIEDLPIAEAFKSFGLNLIFTDAKIDFGWILQNHSGRAEIKSILNGGTAFKNGLNCGDEIIAINGKRVMFSYCDNIEKYLKVDKQYSFTLSRQGELLEIVVIPFNGPENLEAIEVIDIERTNNFFN